MKRILWGSLALLLLAGCAKKEIHTLVLADPDQAMVAPLYIADIMGYYEEEGLTLEYLTFTSGRDSINAVVEGKADFGAATEFPVANNVLAGNNIKVLSSLYRCSDNDTLIARRDKGINTIVDLKGKRVGLTLSTNSEYLLTLILREANLTEDDITKLSYSPSDIDRALYEGEVDAVIAWNPNVERTINRFNEEELFLYISPAYLSLSVMAAHSKSLEEKKEAFHKLLRALVKAETYMQENPEESLELILGHFNNRSETLLRKTWDNYVFLVRIDNLLLNILTSEAVWVQENYRQDLSVPDFMDYMAPGFLYDANPYAVTIDWNKEEG